MVQPVLTVYSGVMEPNGSAKRYAWLLLDADGTLFDYDAAEAAALKLSMEQVGLLFDEDVLDQYRERSMRASGRRSSVVKSPRCRCGLGGSLRRFPLRG